MVIQPYVAVGNNCSISEVSRLFSTFSNVIILLLIYIQTILDSILYLDTLSELSQLQDLRIFLRYDVTIEVNWGNEVRSCNNVQYKLFGQGV